MNSEEQSVSLDDIETLFLDLNRTGLPTNLDHTTFTIVMDAIRQHVLKLEVKGDLLFSFLNQYIHHENWKLRACAIVFLSILMDKKIRIDKSSFISYEKKSKPRLWEFLGDPEPRIVEYLAQLINRRSQNWNWWWHYGEIGGLARPPLDEERLRALNLVQLANHLPEIDSTVRLEAFAGLVCLIAERIRFGDGHQLKPLILQLIELALPKDSFVRTPTKEWPEGGGFLLLELLRLLWRIPPLHVNPQWLHTALDFIEDFGAFGYELLEDLGCAIIHSHDLEALTRFLNLSLTGIFSSESNYSKTIACITKALVPQSLKEGWNEGVHALLMFAINEATWLYEDEHAASFEDLIIQLAECLEDYINTRETYDPELVEGLAKLYDSSINHSYPLHPNLEIVLIQLGQSLEQRNNKTVRDFCLTKDFMLPVQGMLKEASVSNNSDWLIEIVSALIEAFKHHWQRVQNFIQSRQDPKDTTTILRKVYQQFRLNSLKSPLDPSYNESDFMNPSRRAFTNTLGTNLYLLAETFLLDSLNPSLRDTVLTHLYRSHSVWLLRLLSTTLYYAIHYSNDCPSACFDSVGSLWNLCSHTTEVEAPHMELDFTWLKYLFFGCTGHPTARSQLIQQAKNPTCPLILRELSLLILTRYDPEVVTPYLHPIYKWFPKEIRKTVVWVLGILQESRSIPSLIETMRDKDPKLRSSCAWALGELKDSRAFDPLLALLTDSDTDVRIEGIIALGKLGDSRAIPPLLAVWEALDAQLSKIGAHCLITMFGWQENYILTWRRTAAAVRGALQNLGIDVPPLTEKEALKKYGLIENT